MLLFFDIDGTLFSNKTHRIPTSTLEAIEKAREKGHMALINTGRTKSGMQKELWDLPFDGYLLGCGSRIIFRGKTLYSSSFPMETGKKIISLLNRYSLDAFLEGSDDVYVRRGDYHLAQMNRIRDEFRKAGFSSSAYIEDGNFLYDKFILISSDPENTQKFFDDCSEWIDVIDRGAGIGPRTWECIQKGCSKANAMKILSDHLNIPLSDSAAFGDSANDLGMLQAAGHGIVMGDHSKELDCDAFFITDTVENDGIAKAMKKLGLF